MNIKKIIIRNFYSFREAEFDFSKTKGLTLIKGENKDSKGSNGSGKSAIFEALFFGLTGKTIRKSVEDGIVNNQVGKGCEVEVYIDGNVVIKRGKRPTHLEFWVDNKNISKENAIETQKLIDNTLNTNYKVLSSSMFFGQNNDLNFLDASAEDKRTIIRGFLNLDDIFQYRDRIKEYKSYYSNGSKNKESILDSHKKNVISLKDKLRCISEDKGKYASFEEHSNLTVESILEEEKRFDKRTKLIYDLKLNHIKLSASAIEYEQKIKVGPIKKSGICSLCGTEVDSSIHESEIKNTESLLEATREEIKKLEEEIASTQSACCPPKISSGELALFLQLKALKKEEDTYLGLIQDYCEKIKKELLDKNNLDLGYEVMRFWEKAFSEQGIIKFIIRNVLTYLNEKTNHYLSFLTNSKYFLYFDSELSEKIITGGRETHYISLSGGEKRKINLAVMLALRDLLVFTDKDKTNVIFFDEIAENLDDDGVYGLYLLLENIKKEKNVYIITHNKHLKGLLESSKKILVVKHNGISKIVRRK